MRHATSSAFLCALLALSAACRGSTHQPTGAALSLSTAGPAGLRESVSGMAATSGAAASPDAGLCSLGPESLALPAAGGRCDAKQCEATGGLCTYGGFACPNVCSRRTHDGGKRCRGSSDCEAGCFGPDYVPAGLPAEGLCSFAYVNRGCKNPVEKGAALGRVCAE